MPQENTVLNSGFVASLVPFLDAQSRFIEHLKSGKARVRPANRIWPLLALHRRELTRRAAGHLGTREYFDELRATFYLLAVVVERHVDRLDALYKQGKQPTRDERRAVRFLNAALADVMAGLDDLETRFAKKSLKHRFHQILGNLFWELTPQQVDSDVLAIRKFIQGAVAEKQQGQTAA
jgi:hypothetical protein